MKYFVSRDYKAPKTCPRKEDRREFTSISRNPRKRATDKLKHYRKPRVLSPSLSLISISLWFCLSLFGLLILLSLWSILFFFFPLIASLYIPSMYMTLNTLLTMKSTPPSSAHCTPIVFLCLHISFQGEDWDRHVHEAIRLEEGRNLGYQEDSVMNREQDSFSRLVTLASFIFDFFCVLYSITQIVLNFYILII